jgi:hypothetical protein
MHENSDTVKEVACEVCGCNVEEEAFVTGDEGDTEQPPVCSHKCFNILYALHKHSFGW